jgi:hypothetical protein
MVRNIVGVRVCWLPGYVRQSPMWIFSFPKDMENHARVIAALSELEDRAAAELTPRDFVEIYSSRLLMKLKSI